MKRLSGMVALLFVLGASARVSYKGHQVLRIEPRDFGDRTYLRKVGDQFRLRFWKEPERAFGFVDVVVPESKLQAIKELMWENKIPYDVLINDLETAIKSQVSPREAQMTLAEFDYNVYHPFEEIEMWLTNFAMANPQHVTKMKVGMSYENRTFNAVKISSGGTRQKPAFAIDCGIHADEWISPATCIHVIQNLTENIGKQTMAGEIIEAVDFYIIPSANPDGYHHTWTKDRLWRKTRSPTSNHSCIGVDPNRNWDSNFGGNGSSNDPCSDDYHGPHAWSEANVRAQRDFVNGIQHLQAYIDIHSYSQLWMFPYGYTFDKPRDFDLLSRIANASAEAIKEVHGKEYTPGQIAKVIYVASGSTADYFYDHLKLRCVFAAELRDKGKYGMLLPEYEILPTAQEIFAGLMEIAANVMAGHCDPM